MTLVFFDSKVSCPADYFSGGLYAALYIIAIEKNLSIKNSVVMFTL